MTDMRISRDRDGLKMPDNSGPSRECLETAELISDIIKDGVLQKSWGTSGRKFHYSQGEIPHQNMPPLPFNGE